MRVQYIALDIERKALVIEVGKIAWEERIICTIFWIFPDMFCIMHKKCGHGLSVLQLMKILYFVQAQFLISRKKRAFSDEIVAMDWGPVERKVWSHYKSCGNGYIPVLLGINFVKEEKEYIKAAEKIYIEDIKLINGIVDLLLGYDNTYLMSIIRKQPPFIKGLKNFPGYEISDKDMMDFFK